MIITEQKPFEEILKGVSKARKLFLVGCGDCAALCRTGGETELKEMAEKLDSEGISVTGSAVVDAPCHELDTQRVLRKHKKEVEAAEAFLVLTCGAGVQAVGDSSDKPAVSGCDSLFIGNSRRQMHFYEKCSACGYCVLNLTGGLCPETRCPKGLLNAGCGGAVRGMCEVDEKQPCVWIEIYERMKKQGRLDDLMEMVPAKDYSVSKKPGKIEEPVRSGR